MKPKTEGKELSLRPRVWKGDDVGRSHNRSRTAVVHVPASVHGTNYVTTALQPRVAPFMQNHPGYVLHQDNAPAHRARETQAYLAEEQIGDTHPWPAESPDMNVIEHVGTFSAVTSKR
ncbi:transposable element tcb1 transposase [Plakobranchus ocellatus]|uniref:Transposable element tcb1 transposase n=1 Tax=Plakobranchus ocellatus TaxID=259542 RepID=A0AAV4DN52_9GAST|nr:transposable element tcb1 transposase [Plakobranchus ocellatus]